MMTRTSYNSKTADVRVKITMQESEKFRMKMLSVWEVEKG